jgi:hypothetical protein
MTAKIRRLRRRPLVHRPEPKRAGECETCQGTGAIYQAGDGLVSVAGLRVQIEYRPPRPVVVAEGAKVPPEEMSVCPDCGGTGRKR